MEASGFIQLIGLGLDITGAVYLSMGIGKMTEDEALLHGVSRVTASTREEQLKSPGVQKLLKESRNAKIGVRLLIFGFTLQGISLFS